VVELRHRFLPAHVPTLVVKVRTVVRVPVKIVWPGNIKIKPAKARAKRVPRAIIVLLVQLRPQVALLESSAVVVGWARQVVQTHAQQLSIVQRVQQVVFYARLENTVQHRGWLHPVARANAPRVIYALLVQQAQPQCHRVAPLACTVQRVQQPLLIG
jgi:hypothetical protein